jgi:hypothetical protein
VEFVIKEILVLINRLLYCAALIPLVVKNYQLKTSRGLSDYLVWFLFNGYIALTTFSFCLGLPIAYGAISFLQLCIAGFIVGQRFWYDKFDNHNFLVRVYVINVLICGMLIPVAITWPYQIGHLMGWVALICFVSKGIPQIIKVQRAQSVYGFTYWFSAILAIAAVLELRLVFVYNLPLQMVATASWSLIAFFIFTAQFYAFSWRRSLRQ